MAIATALLGFNDLGLIGPFKPYLGENISLQSSNCDILGLAATVAFFANETQFTQLKGMFSPKGSRLLPIFLTLLTSITHHLSMVKFSEKKINVRKFARERP